MISTFELLNIAVAKFPVLPAITTASRLFTVLTFARLNRRSRGETVKGLATVEEKCIGRARKPALERFGRGLV
jgi:hypothetical protein